MITKEIIESCFKWLGYGNPNSPLWIIGKEEGTLEVDINKKTPEESLKIRSNFEPVMDFEDVWQNKFGVQLSKVTGSSHPWRFSSRFILALRGKENISDSDIDRFIIKELGRTVSDHFLTDFLPLPKKNVNSIKEYKNYFKSVKDYVNQVVPVRFELITGLMKSSDCLNLIISYDNIFSKKLLKEFDCKSVGESWASKTKRGERLTFQLYEFNIEDRTLFLLPTPFFGEGWMHKLDVSESVKHIKKYTNVFSGDSDY